MALISNLELLRKLLEQCDRLHELERADLLRRIKEQEHPKPLHQATQLAGRARLQRLLKAMQQQGNEPLLLREIVRRLELGRKTVSHQLKIAMRLGYVDRVDTGLYQVRKEVPQL